MKRVKIFIALMLAAAIANAQEMPKPSPEEHLKRSQEMLQKELQMNADEQKKVEQAFKDFMTAADKLRRENPPPPPPPMDPKVKEALDNLIQQRDVKIKMALTDEQYKKFLELEKKMHPPHPGDKDDMHQPHY